MTDALTHTTHVPASRRVLHLVNGEHYSGAERVQDLLALTLPSYGFEVGFVCLKPERFPVCRQSQVPLFKIPMQSKLDLRVARQIADIAITQPYCLIHAHTPRAALVGRIAALIAKLPMVYHVHSPARHDSPDRGRNRVNALSEQFSLARIPAIITVSRALLDYMKHEGFPEHRLHVAANGVPAKASLAPWLRPEGRPWQIGMAALFRPRKGLEILLKAMAQLHKRGIDVHLHAVGPFESEEYENSMHGLAHSLELEKAIQWKGYTAHMDDAFSQMDIFVLPSLYGEGLPMVLLEAMAAGVPVVASEVEGVTDAIRHNIEGILAKAGDAIALADVLQDAMEGKYSLNTLRKNAYDRQRNEFSDEAMAASVAAIYRKVLK